MNISTFHECPPQAALSSQTCQALATSDSLPSWNR
jgi:hypothetical protein